MTKVANLIPALFMCGCAAGGGSDVFNTQAVDYQRLDMTPLRAQTRVFVKQRLGCDYREPSADAGGLVLAVGAFVIKQAVSYGADVLKQQAEYLKSDVILSGKSSLATAERSGWPTDASAGSYATRRNSAIEQATTDAYTRLRSPNAAKNVNDRQLNDALAKTAEAAGANFDAMPNTKIAGSADDLCVLIVAGNYQPRRNTDSLSPFAEANSASKAKISAYASVVPGIAATIQPQPFGDLVGQPAMVVELHAIATGGKDTVLYTLIPTNIFYPHPLHKGAVNGLERKLTIKIKLDGQESTMTFDHLKSGAVYGVGQLADNYQQFTAPLNQRFQSINVTIAEGADTMPTAKMLEAAAGQQDKVNDYLLNKLTENKAQ